MDWDFTSPAMESPTIPVTITSPTKPIVEITKTDPNKKYYIIGGVLGVIFLIAIIVAAALLARRPPTPTPTISVSPTQHFPIVITPINVIQVYEVNVSLGGITPIACLLYLQNTIAGIIFSANNVMDNFKTVDIVAGTQHSSNDFPVSIGYSAYDSFNGATFATNTKLITIFQLGLITNTVNNKLVLNSVPTNDKTKFNPNLYIVSNHTSSVIVASFVISPTLQSYNLIAYQQDGTLLANLKLPSPIPVASDYILLLASSQQDFFDLLLFDQTQSLIYDIFYTGTSTNTMSFNVSGSIVSATCSQSTNILLVLTTNSVYLFTRTIVEGVRPVFQLTDFFTFQLTLTSIALDSTSEYYCIGTTSKSILVGKMANTLFSDLRLIDVSKQPTALSNTNGPNGIQVSATNIYILQCDTTQNSALFQLAIF